MPISKFQEKKNNTTNQPKDRPKNQIHAITTLTEKLNSNAYNQTEISNIQPIMTVIKMLLANLKWVFLWFKFKIEEKKIY